MRRYRIFHETVYRYSAPVVLGPQKLLVRPREGHDIRIESATLTITPLAVVKWHRDEYDNSVAIARFNDDPVDHLHVVSEAVVEHFDEWPLDFLVEDYAVAYPFAYDHDEHLALSPFLRADMADDEPVFQDWVRRFNDNDGVETYVLLSQVSDIINSEFRYQVREEPGVQSAEQTLSLGSGSCRDFTWLFMRTARRLGLAARFVSGYLHAPGTDLNLGATHAWAEIYLPGAGWKGFDPTIGRLTGSQHIPTAVSIMPESIPPISGSFTGAQEIESELEVRVSVEDL